MSSSPPEERQGIFGLETEHAILYLPAVATGGHREPPPPFEVLERVLFDGLLAGRKAAVSSGLKGGYFLENGGLAHVEIFLRTPADSPILEVATPETRSPWDLLAYSRAFDQILEETSRRSEPLLANLGCPGALVLGKNNMDSRGVGFGCHENYLVHCGPTRLLYAALVAASPLLIVFFLPPLLLVFAMLLVAALAFAVARLLPPLGRWATGKWHALVRERPRLIEAVRVLYFGTTNAVLLPAVVLYSLVIRWLVFRPFTRDLTSFLATRSIITGSGCLDFHAGRYETSQRARLTRTVAEIVMFGRRKTMFDLKAFLFDPLALFRPMKKLTLACGDSNLGDLPNLLKVAATGLLIEMLEAGVSFADLRLRRPVRAFRLVSREGPWKRLRLRSGKTMNGLEIQRAFLARAVAFFKERPPGRMRHDEVLRLWEDTLDQLADQPARLADTLDWAAKKALLDRAILPLTNWKVFFAWGKLFQLAGLEATARASRLEDLFRGAHFLLRLRLLRHADRAGLDPSEFAFQKDLYFQAQKIDLKFHQLGGGYQRALEADGLIRRLIPDEAVVRAVKEPPPDTRARVRGYYIQQSPRPEALQVNWNEIEIRNPLRHIPTPNPFQHRLPLE